MRFALALAAAAALAAPAAAQPWQPDFARSGGPGSLTLFHDAGFGGGALTLDQDAPSLVPFRFNDAASSAQTNGGVWELCEHVYFQGRCWRVGGAEPDFRRLGANDTVSSARRVSGRGGGWDDRGRGRGRGRGWDDDRGGGWGRGDDRGGGWDRGGGRGGAVLFEHERFEGRALPVSDHEPDLRRHGFNDSATSLRLGGGLWEVCEDVGFGGRCHRLSGDVWDLRSLGLHDRISSLRRIR